MKKTRVIKKTQEYEVCDLCGEEGQGVESEYSLYPNDGMVYHKRCKDVLSNPERFEELVKKAKAMKG